jgi:hypothetical protein
MTVRLTVGFQPTAKAVALDYTRKSTSFAGSNDINSLSGFKNINTQPVALGDVG